MSRRLAVLLAVSTGLAACQGDRQGPTESERSEPEAPVGNVAPQEPLFTIVASPVLTSGQAGVLSRMRNRSSAVEVHVGFLRTAPHLVLQRGAVVVFDVSPTQRFVAVGEQAVHEPTGALSWAGRLRNESGWVQLVLTAKGVTGTLRTATSLYRFEPIDGGFHALIQVGTLPPEHPPESPSGAVQPPSEAPAASEPIARADLSAESVPTTIDVLVVYTPAVTAAVTDVAGLIQQAINETNTSYSNSGVNATLRSVYSSQVSYSEAGRTYQQHVSALQSTSDGMMDIVHTWRNQYRADVVVLLVNDPASCGIASQILATQATAFAVVYWDCATGDYSFGHEIGHLQGARHDRYVDGSGTPYAYGHGYVDPVNYNWRTIMAYRDSCIAHTGHSCLRVQYWSNPNVTYPPTGQVMGTATYEHDARVLDQTKITIANFRSSLVPTWTGPTYSVGHTNTCPWTATITGGTPPYTYNWYASWTSQSTGFYFVSGQGTANASSYGYYYLTYPPTTVIRVSLSGSDAAGEQYYLERSINMDNYPSGCR